MAEKLFKYATQIAQDAIDLDNRGNYKQAYEQYLRAADILLRCIQFTDNPELRQIYYERAQKYVKRCKQIKKSMASLHTVSSMRTSLTMKEDGEDEEELSKAISSTIIAEKPNIKWSDVANLNTAKQALREAIILPMMRPDLFEGARKPWKGILLFGPPGCGKTLIAKAVASEVKATFFNVSAASIVSKWLGESEKLIKELFNAARAKQPSIVFIDEVDSVATKREGDEVGGERRLKTQLMQEMDGLTSSSKDRIIVLGATNVPWELDPALRRRFEKRIYIGMPEEEARKEIFKIHTRGVELEEDVDFDELAKLTEGYVGSDIAMICREALMMPIRELDAADALNDKNVKVRPVNRQDFLEALRGVKPVVSPAELVRFKQWAEEFAVE
ncbi:MAG: ATP-binding protein [Candidatus Jordarchaeaceae archaeon]